MNKEFLYSMILLCGVFLSAVSQIMLKVSARKQYPSKIKEYLNPLVITAYGIFFGCTFLSMYSLKVISLSLSTILETCGYVFVSILGVIFLKEKISRKKAIGIATIIIGVLIYSL